MQSTSLFLLALFSCREPAPSGPAAQPDGFGGASTLRWLSPEQGQSLKSPVSARFSAGEQIATLVVFDGDAPLTERLDTQSAHLSLELDPGRHTLRIEGYGADSAMLSSDQVSINVLDPQAQSWINISSPLDGAHTSNPVTFVVDASSDVSRVTFSADDWPIGEITPEQVLTYRFENTDIERSIRAQGFDSRGTLLASQDIIITPLAGSDGGPTAFSERVAEMVERYPKDGTYIYYWPQGGSWSGSTRDLFYREQQVASDGGYSACYCSGITWEWYLSTWQELAQERGLDAEDLNGVNDTEIWTMRRDWYVRDLDGPGPNSALQSYGLGQTVGDWDQVVRGDFVQFWRTSGSGHTVVFWGWRYDESGNRSGFEYASCQGEGLGFHSEYFGTHSGAIDPALVYFGRAWMPEDWQ